LPDLEGITVTGGRLNLNNSLDLMFPVEVVENNIPTPSIRLTNYPNPFNPTTTISLEAKDLQENAQIEIYNLKGQIVKTLSLSLSEDEGEHNTMLFGAVRMKMINLFPAEYIFIN